MNALDAFGAVLKKMNSAIQYLGYLLILCLVVFCHSVAASTIASGDRIMMHGDQWKANDTEGQLGMEVVRLSSFKPFSDMEQISSNPNLKLFIGIAGSDSRREPSDGYLTPPSDMWLGYPTLSDSVNAFLTAFQDSLTLWKNRGLKISAIMCNLETPYANFSPAKTSEELAQATTLLMKSYNNIINTVCSDSTEFWVYSSKRDSVFEGTVIDDSYLYHGCDWQALTTGTNAIDVCLISAHINTSPVNGPVGEKKKVLSRDLKEVMDNSNGKSVVIQVHTYGNGDEYQFSYIRDKYQRYWNDFRELIRHAKSTVDSVSSSIYGTHKPVAYWQGHYKGRFTIDAGGVPPTGVFPWPDGQNYPARLWTNGQEWNWAWNYLTPDGDQPHNIWEREFITNFLTATGTTLPGRQITYHQSWSGDVYLIGDVEIASGVTVTLQPGTRIFLRPNADVYEAGADNTLPEIIVNGGTLIASGTQADSVYLQSAFTTDPDTFAAKGDWYGIRVLNNGTLNLNYAVISEAETGVYADSTASVTVTNTEIRDCNTGLWMANPKALILSKNTLWDNVYAVRIEGSDGVSSPSYYLGNHLIYDNVSTGIHISKNIEIDVVNNTIVNSKTGLQLTPGTGTMQVNVLNTIFSQNATNAIHTDPGSLELVMQYSDVWGGPTNPFTGTIGSWPNPPNGYGEGNANTANIANDPLLEARSLYRLSKFSGGVDLGVSGSYDPDGTRINMGRYGGTADAEASPMILNGGFEAGDSTGAYVPGWTINTPWSINGTWPLKNGYSHPGIVDNQVMGSYPPESGTGTLTSAPFTITQKYINFKIGGQDQTGNSNDVILVLTSNPTQAIKLSKPPADNSLIYITWDVENYINNEAKIIVEDRNGNGSYAWFCVDAFEQSNAAKETPSGDVGGGTTVYLDENFEDGQAQGWSPVSGSWTVKTVDSSKRYVMESSSQGVNRSYVNVTGWSGGYTIETKIKFAADEGKVLYAKANQNERYRLDLMANSNTFRLMIDDNAHEINMTIDKNTWYDVKIEVTGSYVKTWLNGSPKHDISIGGAPDGYIGIGSYEDNPSGTSDHVLVDDVKLSSVSSPPTKLAIVPDAVPVAFSIEQNTPNPFNPETTITYALPQESEVSLVVYNVLGQPIRSLVSGPKSAGQYRVVWDSKDVLGHPVSSGIYIYRMIAGDFVMTRKMLVLK